MKARLARLVVATIFLAAVLASPVGLSAAGHPGGGEPAAGLRTTVSFQQDRLPSPRYDGAADATIEQARPGQHQGSNETCRVDGNEPFDTGMDVATLLRWDLSALPEDSTVTSAWITLHVTNASVHEYHLYPVGRAWAEDEVTWMQYRRGMFWSRSGATGPGDRGSTRIGTLNASQAGPAVIMLNSDGVALVQRWISQPSSNHGLIVQNTEAGDGIDFKCDPAPTTAERPILTVSYR